MLLVALAGLLVSAGGPTNANGAGTVLGRSARTTATRLCGVLSPRQTMEAGGHVDAAKPVSLTPKASLGDFELAGGLIYVATGSGAIEVFTATGHPVRAVRIRWKRTISSFAVAPGGRALYVQAYPYDLVKVSLSGKVIWSVTMPGQIDGIFGHRLGATWVAGAVFGSTARLFDQSGHYVGRRDMSGQTFADTPDGGLIATDGRYVRKYDNALHQVFYFGGGGAGGSPAAGQFDFYLQGGATQLPDGRYLVADATRGLELFSRAGILLGTLPDTQLGNLTNDSPLHLLGSTLYMETGGPFSPRQTLSTMRLSDVLGEVLQPSGSGPGLGIGAGVRLGSEAGYFPAGQAPTATAVFDRWWGQLNGLRLEYTVESRTQAEMGGGETHSVPLGSAAIGRGVPLRLPAASPGPYEIDLRLFEGTTAVAAQCVDYGVGAPGDQLDLATLPGTSGAGVPSGDRGAALAAVFGMNGVRVSLDWSQLLPHGVSGPTDFSAYDAEIAAASKEAAAMHVQFSVQIGSGGPEKTFVANGTWGTRVQQVVDHWKGEVHYWEAWNEPNATFGPAPSYVDKVLEPFYAAVKAADPTAQVIGGTVVGMDLGYWQAIAAAGGFRYMDIAAIHPYPGHNRSWEEQGFPAAYQALRALMSANGAAAMPVWITEVGWWSDGPNDYFDQADRVVRAELWMHALGIDVCEYLMYQGTTGDGLLFSLIEGDTDVKPSALGAMVETTQTQGRSFAAWLPTAMPMTYAEAFGPRMPGDGTVVALWTDDVALPAVVRLTSGTDTTATLVDEYGATRQVSLVGGLHLTLDGAVQYLDLPPGDGLAVAPPESYGPDLALAQSGASATASSSTVWNPPAKAIDGDTGAANVGDLAGSPAWGSGYGDGHPQLTVRFARPERIDRVLMVTSSVGSTMPGIRSWQIAVRDGSGPWRLVAAYRNLFFDRAVLSRFAPVTATEIRVAVDQVNFGGYAGGAEPWFWPKSTAVAAKQPNDYAYGPAIVRELEAFAPAAPQP